MKPPLIVDAHEDLAWNMVSFGRDYRRLAAETRQHEQQSGSLAPQVNGDTLLGWPDYQRGRVAVVFSTLYIAPERGRLGDWDKQCYSTISQATQLSRQQLEAYQRLAGDSPDMFRLVGSRPALHEVLAHWQRQDIEEHPVGLVLLMENAEGVGDPGELEGWWANGLRIIGPAWLGTRFCGGTREPGPLTPLGYVLLGKMAELGFTLDISHMDEQAALQALDFYPRQVIASHANALAMLKGSQSNRHLSDRLIQALLERGGIIGVVPFGPFLRVDWKESGGRAALSLDLVAAQIDYICQKAGHARQVGLGSDFDGGFGVQSVPPELDSVADLQKITPLLAQRGYTEENIASILGGNWLACLESTLPEVD